MPDLFSNPNPNEWIRGFVVGILDGHPGDKPILSNITSLGYLFIMRYLPLGFGLRS